MTILIADDFAPIRKSLRRMLESLSNVKLIVEAADGIEAYDLLTRLKPDVLILDLQMPRKTGLELLQEPHFDLSMTTVIVLTNYSDTAHLDQSMRFGADYFFDKSTEFEKVVEIVRARVE